MLKMLTRCPIQCIYNRKWLAKIETLTHSKPIPSKHSLSNFFPFKKLICPFVWVFSLFSKSNSESENKKKAFDSFDEDTVCLMDLIIIIISLSIETSLLLATFIFKWMFGRSSPVGIYQYRKTRNDASDWVHHWIRRCICPGIALVLVPVRRLSHSKRTHKHIRSFPFLLSFLACDGRIYRVIATTLPLFDHLRNYLNCECHSIWQRWMVPIEINVEKEII